MVEVVWRPDHKVSLGVRRVETMLLLWSDCDWKRGDNNVAYLKWLWYTMVEVK